MINWIILAIFVLLFIYLGNKSRRIASDKSEAGFLLAGRTLGPFVCACTIAATATSGWAFIGSPGVAYQFGVIEMIVGIFYSVGMVVAILFFGEYLVERARELGSLTIPEYVAQRHATGVWSLVLHGIAALLTIGLMLVFLVSQFKALALVASPWLGISLVNAAIIFVAIIVIYTAVGGLLAVAWTDTVMLLGMVVGVSIILVEVFRRMGIGELTSALSQIDPKLLNPPTSVPYGDYKSSVFLFLPYTFIFMACLPYMAVRLLAVKPNIKWHKLAAWVTPMSILCGLAGWAGIFVRIVKPPLADPDQAMPVFLQSFVHPAAAGLITIFILFAVKSTANSILHTIASAVSYDLRKSLSLFVPIWNSISPSAALTVNRLAVVVLGVLGLILLITAPPFFLAWLGILGTGTLAAALVGPVFISSLWRGNAIGALVSMLGGAATSAWFMVVVKIGWITAPLVGSLIGAVLYVVVSILTFGIQPRLATTVRRS